MLPVVTLRLSTAVSWYCEFYGDDIDAVDDRAGDCYLHGREIAMQDLKERTIRGGFAKVCAQAATFLLRVGSLIVLARLLDPVDFGLVGMVTALTGVLNLFRDFGLSTATVQRVNVTEEQISTLFWINVLVGAILGLLAVGIAPVVVVFYHEPRLFGVTAVLATGFLFNAAGVQHSAILQRHMRFSTLATIDIVSLVVSSAIGIGMAVGGYGYWALVVMTVTLPLVATVCLWLTTAWIPGRPRKQVGIRSMMRFGGTITLNCLVVYIAYNFEKILLGRFWGAEAIGMYGRAYQLISIPTDNLNSAVGGVALAALSRLQDDANRLKTYFLKGYSFVLALTVPMTIVCALFADDLIAVLLGSKWTGTAVIFRLLAPTILIFALINPLWWLLVSTGLIGRSLNIALIIAPLVIAGYVIGLPYGPTGVALSYSSVMTLWVLPHIAWCVHGTIVSFQDIMVAVSRPLLSGCAAVALAFGVQRLYGQLLPPLPRLVLGVTVLLGVYLGMLMYVMGQKAFYLDLLRGMRSRSPIEEGNALVSAKRAEHTSAG
jgi:O-antigen/teichoic acid export membrane protein